jgi:hypothetical protein
MASIGLFISVTKKKEKRKEKESPQKRSGERLERGLDSDKI